jgi:hypothetical protein
MRWSSVNSPVQFEPKALLARRDAAGDAGGERLLDLFGQLAICCAWVRLLLRWTNTSHMSTRSENSLTGGSAGA